MTSHEQLQRAEGDTRRGECTALHKDIVIRSDNYIYIYINVCLLIIRNLVLICIDDK